jgi:UDP-glucose 6-dehydrogenase
LEIDYDKVVEYATKDNRLGHSHWAVPGPMPASDGSGKLLPGFSGSCFCKDLNALIKLSEELGVDPKVMKATWAQNLFVRPEKDWECLIGRAVSD